MDKTKRPVTIITNQNLITLAEKRTRKVSVENSNGGVENLGEMRNQL